VRVLVAHSQARVRRRLREPLEKAGHQILETDTAAGALAACRRESPEVAVVQAGLRAEDGRSALERLKGDTEAFGVAVVLVQPRDVKLDEAVAALRGGAADLLVEPLRPADILARVRAAARTKELQDEFVAQTQRLESLLHEDPLTRLLNRRSVLTQLDGMISGARRHHRPISVAMIDVDHFKALNDRYGHQVGDRALTMVARTMRERLRGEDLLGRLGGEEFLAVLPDADLDAAAVAAEKLRAGVAGTRLTAGEEDVQVNVSVGWASWGGESAEDLIRRADEALYEAKLGGRDVVRGATTGRPAATLPGRR
jgi:two-component system, cell cycle response regulator